MKEVEAEAFSSATWVSRQLMTIKAFVWESRARAISGAVQVADAALTDIRFAVREDGGEEACEMYLQGVRDVSAKDRLHLR